MLAEANSCISDIQSGILAMFSRATRSIVTASMTELPCVPIIQAVMAVMGMVRITNWPSREMTKSRKKIKSSPSTGKWVFI